MFPSNSEKVIYREARRKGEHTVWATTTSQNRISSCILYRCYDCRRCRYFLLAFSTLLPSQFCCSSIGSYSNPKYLIKNFLDLLSKMEGWQDIPVPEIVTSCSFKFADTDSIPDILCSDVEMSFIQLSQVIGTANSVYNAVNIVPEMNETLNTWYRILRWNGENWLGKGLWSPFWRFYSF